MSTQSQTHLLARTQNCAQVHVFSKKITLGDIERITEEAFVRAVSEAAERRASQGQITSLPEISSTSSAPGHPRPCKDGPTDSHGREKLFNLIAEVERLQDSYAKKLVRVGELSREVAALKRGLLGAQVQMQTLFISLHRKRKEAWQRELTKSHW